MIGTKKKSMKKNTKSVSVVQFIKLFILNTGGSYAERICYLEKFVVKVYSSILGYEMKIEVFWSSRAQRIL